MALVIALVFVAVVLALALVLVTATGVQQHRQIARITTRQLALAAELAEAQQHRDLATAEVVRLQALIDAHNRNVEVMAGVLAGVWRRMPDGAEITIGMPMAVPRLIAAEPAGIQ